MYIYYNVKTDYLEIMYTKTSTYGEIRKNGIIYFKSNNTDKIVGYGIEDASSRMDKILFFTPFEKLSIIIKMSRIKHGYTQIEVAKKMGIKLLPYQRLESGTNNPTLKTLIKLKEVLPEIELSKVA